MAEKQDKNNKTGVNIKSTARDFNANTRFENIDNKDGFYVTLNVLSPDTASSYGTIYIANFGIMIREVRVVWGTASTSGTLNIERLSGTEALDAGDEIFKTDIDMSGTANTVITKKTSTDLQNTKLSPGDRIAFKDGGTLTNQANLCITIYLIRLGKGDYR